MINWYHAKVLVIIFIVLMALIFQIIAQKVTFVAVIL